MVTRYSRCSKQNTTPRPTAKSVLLMYEKIQNLPDDGDDEPGHHQLAGPALSRRMERLGFVFVITLLAVCNVLLVFAGPSNSASKCFQGDSFETGFATDIMVATPHLEITSLKFTGGVDKHPDGSRFLNLSGSSAIYVGEPSPEIEKNWAYLESAISLILGEEENILKDGTPIETMKEPGEPGMYRLSLDVIHTLHCLNRLRKAVYADHYFPPRTRNAFYFTHMNHCIEHIRQTIQCHADITPLVYEFNEETNTGNPIWTSTHTCRNFEKLLAWDKTREGKSLFPVKKGSGT